MGIVFDIAGFSLNDGPGIRPVVFFKGCPLNCVWCHNPESKKPHPQLAFFADKCAGCRACGFCAVHSFKEKNGGHTVDFTACSACGKCAGICPAGALKIYGTEMSAEEVIKAVIRDKVYFDASKGGITLSGGEPMFQPEFALEILYLAKKENLHTVIETSGFAKREDFQKILPYTDLFLFDYKGSAKTHKKLTGTGRKIIDENLAFLSDNGAEVILRCPVIPGVNEDEEALKEYLEKFPFIKKAERLAYHDLGNYKKKALGNGF